MIIARILSILLLLIMLANIVPITLAPSASISKDNGVTVEKLQQVLPEDFRDYYVVKKYSNHKVVFKGFKMDTGKYIKTLAMKFDRDGDFLNDYLEKLISNGTLGPSDLVTLNVLYSIDPLSKSNSDEFLNTISVNLGRLAKTLVTEVPEVRVVRTYANVIVGMTIEAPANITLLRKVAQILNRDLNGDGIPDLAIIEKPAKRKLFNYFSARQLNLRNVVFNGELVDVYSSLGIDGSTITVAVIDSGIDASTTPLANKVLLWDDLYGDPSGTQNDATPYDDMGHGTHCAGTIAGYKPARDAKGRLILTFGYDNLSVPAGYPLAFSYPITAFYINTTGELMINFTWYADTTSGSGGSISNITLLYCGNVPYYSARRVYRTCVALDDQVLVDTPQQNVTYTIRYNITNSSQFGWYSIAFGADTSGYIALLVTIHAPVENSTYGSMGMAPGAKLAGWKVCSYCYWGGCDGTAIDNALQYAIGNRTQYNITVISMSLGGGCSDTTELSLLQQAFNSGVLVVAAAGNEGVDPDGDGRPEPNANNTCPGASPFALQVAAVDSLFNNITEYSSMGGPSTVDSSDLKPDVAAPGGGQTLQIWSGDTTWHDDHNNCYCTNYNRIFGCLSYAEDVGWSELNASDVTPMMGTSMATPHVSGIAALVAQAIKEYLASINQTWNYSSNVHSSLLKRIIIMSTYETYPLYRENDTYSGLLEKNYSPTLDKGGDDPQEGFGMIDALAAVEAALSLKNPLMPGTVVESAFRPGQIYKANLSAGIWNAPYGRSVWLRAFYLPSKVTLPNGTTIIPVYKFKLILNTTDNANADFDLYLYDKDGNITRGEPTIVAKSTNGPGYNESIAINVSSYGKDIIWVAVKRATEDSAGGKWVLVTSPNVEQYGRPYGGADFNASNEAWIGWPIKINGSMTKDITRVVVEIFAQNGTLLARLDSANGDITIVDPAYYSTYNTTWTVPFDNNLVGTYLTVVAYFYDSTGTLVQGPVTTQVYVNAAPEPIPEPSLLPVMLVTMLIVMMAIIMYNNKFRILHK